MAKGFTDKQKKFIASYVACLNKTQAAKEAGYACTSENSFAQMGHETLRNPKVRAEIDRILAENTISPDEVVSRISDHATGSMGDFLNIKKIDDDHHVIRLDLEKAEQLGKLHLIKKFKETETRRKDTDGNEHITLRREVELYDAASAQDKLMRYNSLYKDRVEVITWRDKIVDALRRGEIDKDKVKERLGDKLAVELFLEAGVNAG